MRSILNIKALPVEIIGLENLKDVAMPKKSIYNYLMKNNSNYKFDVENGLLIADDITFKILLKLSSRGNYICLGLIDTTHLHVDLNNEDPSLHFTYDIYTL